MIGYQVTRQGNQPLFKASILIGKEVIETGWDFPSRWAASDWAFSRCLQVSQWEFI